MIDYPNKIDIIFDKLVLNGAKPIIIGGYIRDSLLGMSSKDIDIEVYNISSFSKLELILKEFGSLNSVGKSFGVCKLTYKNIDLDFTLPRVDSKTSFGHKGFEVTIDPNLDFYSAFSRRDFTINAIGFDVKEKLIIDPFNGRKDLKNKVLKIVNEKTFIDDPLRVLRAVQFCARFNLKMDSNLFKISKKMIEDNILIELSKERIFLEIHKLLLKSDKPSIGFILLKEIGALKYFTELDNENIFLSTLKVMDEMKKLLTNNDKTNIILMLSSVCYKFEKKQIINFIQKLTDEKRILNKVLSLVVNHKSINIIYANGLKNSELFNLATKVNIEELLLLSKAIYLSENEDITYQAGTAIRKKAKLLNILNKKLKPLLQGRDIIKLEFSLSIKIEPKKFSTILDEAYIAQMNGKFVSYSQALLWLKKKLIIT